MVFQTKFGDWPRGFEVQTWFKNHGTLRQALGSVKDKMGAPKSRSIVYSIPCQCNKFYLGETDRALRTRAREHQATLSTNQESALSIHCDRFQHCPVWQDVKTVHCNISSSIRRKILEALYIRANSHNLVNRQEERPERAQFWDFLQSKFILHHN